MPRHNHAIYCVETNYLQGNQQKILSFETYEAYDYIKLLIMEEINHSHSSVMKETINHTITATPPQKQTLLNVNSN